jgi:hypothetical protein
MGPFDPMKVGRDTGLSRFADRRVNSAVSVNSFHRLGFATSGLRLDNPRDAVNQFLVWPGDREKTASGKRCGRAAGGSGGTRLETERRGSGQNTASCGVADGERR